MVESYYASPRKVSAIHYFCAPALDMVVDGAVSLLLSDEAG